MAKKIRTGLIENRVLTTIKIVSTWLRRSAESGCGVQRLAFVISQTCLTLRRHASLALSASRYAIFNEAGSKLQTGVYSAMALGALLLPTSALASVQISEVMYDPPGSDAKAEWVELYNAGGAPVDLTGWKFVDGGSPTEHALNVPPKNGGKGGMELAAGAYAVVASDAAIFGEAYPAVQQVIDSAMSMPDTEGTSTAELQLIDADGNIEDSLAYGYDAGANNKGNSLQKTTAGSLISALPTPGAPNAAAAEEPPESGNSGGSSTGAQESAGTQEADSQNDAGSNSPVQSQAAASSYVPPPVPQLFADAGGDRTVIVGADSEFSASAYDRDRNMLSSDQVRFIWNFGDGSTAEGPAVEHHFAYPGRYAVVLSIAEDKTAAYDQIMVTAEPARLSFLLMPSGGISIQNNAGHNLDLSGWLIAQGAAEFILPPHSIVLSGASANITHQTLGFWANAAAELEYPNGTPALKAGESTASSTSSVSAPMQGGSVSSAAARSPLREPAPVRQQAIVAPPAQSAASAPVLRGADEASAASLKPPLGNIVTPPDISVAPSSQTQGEANGAASGSAAQAAAASLGFSSGASDSPLWYSLAGVGALVILGAAGVWYINPAEAAAPAAGEEELPDTGGPGRLAEEFEIIERRRE